MRKDKQAGSAGPRNKNEREAVMKFVKTALIFMILLAGNMFLTAAIPPAERQALIDLYTSTDGANWTNNTNWLGASGTENTWFGVTTDAGNTAVLQLQLISNNLVGTLPASLGNLSNLTDLSLHSNQLTGSIPPELGNLSNLQYLGISSNQLTGSIPPELGNLSNLIILQLSINQLTGSIPAELSNLSNLQQLLLYFNQLTGSIPSSLANLSDFTDLSLHSNQLTGSIPPELGNLSNLGSLDLQANHLTGSIPTQLGNLSYLRVLQLNSNQLAGSIPVELGNLSNLTDLGLDSNQLTGSIPSILTSLTKLDPTKTGFGYNAVYTSDAGLITFLNSKDPGWASTQTIAPALGSAVAGNASVSVSWTPITYTGNTGGYRVFYGTVAGGPYTFYAQTADKSVSSQLVSGLTNGIAYYFVVRTRTDIHANNQNVVDSENSNEATATPSSSPTIAVTSPNGGESWIASTSHNITWTSTGSVGNVNIDYSVNNGSNWSSVASSTENDGTFNWTVPSSPSTTCLLRISDAADGTPSDTSNSVFTILAASIPSITVTLPNGGENWTAGSMVDIDWTSTGGIANVNIDYSIDNGSNWLPILAGTTNDGHSGDWVLPNITSTTCLVRVSDTANTAVNDVSDAVFSIIIREDDIYEENDTQVSATEMAPGIYFGLILRDDDYFKVYVEAGKDLKVATMGAAISSTDRSDIDIEFYNASGNLLVASAGGSAMETLCLSNLTAGWYYIRIPWLGTAHYYALAIQSGDLDMGEISGRVTDIHGSGIANVWVMFYEPGGDWNLVRGYVPTNSNGDYHFAYTAGDHKVLFDACYPTNQVVGSYVNEWYNDVATIDAAQTLATSAGSSLTGINAVLADAGMVTGVITGQTGELLRYAYAQAFDSSGTMKASTYTFADGTYRLRGISATGNYRIRFRPPNYNGHAVEWYNDKNWSGVADTVSVVIGEETANINAQLGDGGTISGTVTDTASGLPIANVTVSARDEADIAFSNGVTNTNGQYTIYQVPACNVKLYFNAGTTGYVSEWYNNKTSFATADLVPVTADQNVTGIDAQLGATSPTITVTSPNGGEIWAIGSGQSITWTSGGVAGTVDITYSANGGSSWAPVATDTANDGLYSWTVPNTPSSTCYVQVLEHGSSLHDSSNAAFTITASTTETISVPNIPGGPAMGTVATSYAYSTSGATSSLGHSVQYLFDWDDGTTSGWLTVGSPQVSHSWGAAGTYNVRAMARCATHTTIESSWSTTLAVIISGDAAGAYNSPAQYKVLPEVIWAYASGGGTWMSEVQVTDISGGSQVSVYYNTSAGRRGPFPLWNNSGGALHSMKYSNMLQTIDGLDSGVFAYYGTVGAVEFVTQDGNHTIQAAARTVNGNYAKTFSAMSIHDSNTVYVGRAMLIPNLTNNATYRSSCGFFNPTDDSVTVELRLRDANSTQVGSTMTKTLAAHGFTAFTPFTEAGVPYPGTASDNVFLSVMVLSGSGKVVCFGASANNTSNDPAAHVAVQSMTGHDNGPANRQILPEAIWAAATGGGTWMSEVQLVDMSGGSQVSVYFDYGGGNRRGPFLLWTGGLAWTKVKYANILQQLGILDALFTYYGKVGTVEFVTQDDSHTVQVTARTLNGDYSKTFPGLNAVAAETADSSRVMLIQNYASSSTYRSTCGFFNPTVDAVTVEFTLLNASGVQIGVPFSKTFVGYDYQAFLPFNEAGVPYPANSYDNVILRVRPTSGTGSVMCFGASANNASNDPASHLAVQAQ